MIHPLIIHPDFFHDIYGKEKIPKNFNNFYQKLIYNDFHKEKFFFIDDHKDTIKNLYKDITELFKSSDFAVTDLSHSRAIIEIEGENAIEILKKGCPFNFNVLEKNNSINSVYNGIAFTVDLLDNNPDKVRLFTLRSFGESLYHSITDASLEFGFKAI